MGKLNGKESNEGQTATLDTNEDGRTLAERADKYRCYQLSVQSADNEVDFFEQAYRECYHKKPFTLREDFCGTFSVCCEWVKSNRQRTAIGIDLCPEALDWGRRNNLSRLNRKEQQRITLRQEDVRTEGTEKVDILAAQNFSFWIFKTRTELRNYFQIAHANLAEKGVMVMDMMGGGDCFTEDLVDKRWIGKGKKKFRYLWEQRRYNPITGDASFYISFKFPDGSKLKHAFEYHWRFWSIPEVRELLAEAGFSKSHVYLEVEDAEGEDTGIWKRSEEAESSPSWLAYIVAQK